METSEGHIAIRRLLPNERKDNRGNIFIYKKIIKFISYKPTVTYNKGSPYEASESRFFTISVCISGHAS